MKHAYFMLPLEPSRTQRHAQTMCKRNVAPSALAWPNQSVLTCPACVRLCLGALQQSEGLLGQLPQDAVESRGKLTHNIQRIKSVLPPNAETLKTVPDAQHKRWPFKAGPKPYRGPQHLYKKDVYLNQPFCIVRSAHTGEWGYVIGTDWCADAGGWFTDSLECAEAAKRAIDEAKLREQDDGL